MLKTSSALHSALYALRLCAALLSAFFLIKWRLAQNDIPQMDVFLHYIGQIDIYRALFYRTAPLALALLFMPRFAKRRLPGLPLAVLAAICGLFALWLLKDLPFSTRSKNFTYDFRGLAALIVSLNIALTIWFHLGDRWSSGSRQSAILALGIIDLLFAPLLWSAYRERLPRCLAPLRVVGVALCCLIPILPLIVAKPSGIYHQIEPDPAFNKLLPGTFYQALLDPIGKALYLTTELNTLVRLNPTSGATIAKDSEQFFDLQGLALDEPSGRLIGVTDDIQTIVLDAHTLEISKLLPHSYTQPIDLDNWVFNKFRTIWDSERRILIASSDQLEIRLCADGRTVIAVYYNGTRRAAELDPRRNELHMVINSELIALNADTLEVQRRLDVGPLPARLAIDPAADCIYITQPLTGIIQKIDLNTYQVIAEIDSFPGVRAIAFDYERRWLIAAGFSPLLEVYSLDDFSLIERAIAPTWARWMVVDQQRDRAYLPYQPSGLWELDLNALEQRAQSCSWQRIDPFYRVLSLLDRLMLRNLIDARALLDQADTYTYTTTLISPDQCPPGDWTAAEE